MAIDPRISLAYVPPVIDWSRFDPLARQQKRLTLQGLMQQQTLRQLQIQQQQLEMQQMQRQMDFQERLNKQLTGGGYGGGNAPAQTVPPEALRPIPPESYLYEEPQLMRPAGPEERGPGTAFAPAGMQTAPITQFAPAGMPSTGSPLAELPDTGTLIRVGGTASFPLIKMIEEMRDAALKRQKTQQEVAIGTAGEIARTLNGIVNEASFKELLPSLALNGVDSGLIHQYMGLGYEHPRTQDWMKSLKGRSLDYLKSLEVQQKLDEATEKRQDRERLEFAQRVGQATDLNQIPDILASSSPYIQQFNSGILKTKTLADAQQFATLGAEKPAVGTTVPYPASVQQQKVETSAAQGGAAAQARQAIEDKEIESLVQAIQRDPTGKLFSELSPQNRERAERILAARGYTAFTTKPTDTERRVLNFYERAKGAEDLINMVPPAGAGQPAPRSLEDIIADKNIWGQLRFEWAPNLAQTPEGRRYWQALRQFTEARLRKESGASIQPHEYAESQATYFPAAGDDKDTLAQKRKARQDLLESMKTEAGPAYTQKYGTAKDSGAAPEKPKYQTIEKTGETPGGRATGTITIAPTGKIAVYNAQGQPGFIDADAWPEAEKAGYRKR